MTVVEPPTTDAQGDVPELRRNLTLPWLVFYGVGVTVGAGIFALIGELVNVSGARAPLAFLVAGAIATITSLSYRDLVGRMPRAGGEAIWVSRGIGDGAGRAVGFGVVAAGIVSSAVVALAFGGYVGEVLPVPPLLVTVLAIAGITAIAGFGARESIMVGGAVTLLEVGALVLVILFGLPELASIDAFTSMFESGGVLNTQGWMTPVLSGAILAFFAFIGFEDIANMAEETVDPTKTAPRAIAWTLGISIVVYVLLSLIAINVADPAAIAASDAPMATLFEMVSGRGSDVIATIAAIAMTNGILAQVMMSSRVIFGMGSERSLGRLSPTLAEVHPRRGTPVRATVLVGTVVTLLAVAVPLVHLARLTSILILAVFTLVNTAEVRFTRRDPNPDQRMVWVGAVGAVLCAALAVWECVSVIGELV